MSELRILKAICEIRYPAAARLFDARGRIAIKWQGRDDLSEWKISQNQVTIHNKPDSTSLQVNYRSAVAIMEMPANLNSFCYLATDFLDDVMNALQINRVERIGLRLLMAAERDKFQVLVRKMRQSLFTLDNDQWEKLGGLPTDIGLPLTLRIGDRHANFNMGPMEREQLTTRFTSKEVKEKLPDVAVFVDFDLFEHDMKLGPKGRINNLRAFIDDCGNKILDMSNEFINQFEGFQ